MASKKDYLRATILSGAVSATRADDSSPIEVSVNPDNYGREQTLVSPVDGYFSLALDDSEADKQYMGVKLSSSGIELSISVNNSQMSFSCFIPVKKGAQVKVSTRGSHKTWWAHFIKVIGGGYKRYLKALVCNRFGGSSWLRLKTTSEWNKARSCLQTRSGLRLSLRPRLSVASTFNLQRLTVKPISLLQKLVGYISKPSQLTKVPTLTLFPSAKKRGCRVAAQQFKQANYLLHKLLCKREGCSTYGLKQSLPMLCTLFRQLVASNNARMEVAA